MVEEKINHIAVKTKELDALKEKLGEELWKSITKGKNKTEVTTEYIAEARKDNLDAVQR